MHTVRATLAYYGAKEDVLAAHIFDSTGALIASSEDTFTGKDSEDILPPVALPHLREVIRGGGVRVVSDRDKRMFFVFSAVRIDPRIGQAHSVSNGVLCLRNDLRADLARERHSVVVGYFVLMGVFGGVFSLLAFVLRRIFDEHTNQLEQAFFDISTANRDLEEKNDELQTTMEDLQRTQALVVRGEKMAAAGMLASGIAHEIKNPLNYVGMCAQALLQAAGRPAAWVLDDTKALLAAQIDGVRRIADIVGSMGRYSREDTADTPCDLPAIIDDCLMMLQYQFKNKITLKKEYAEDVPVILGREGQLHQVFINILANAGQAIEKDGEIIIRINGDEKNVIIEIADNGCGIAPQIMGDIFTPFITTKEKGKGIGLGLSISRDIVREHGGDIVCRSVHGSGTTFVVTLPIIKAERL
jgi:signal transduction histidine kinase